MAKKEQKTIRTCHCGTPMIWTFLFDGAERYCLNCGNSGGMFGTGTDLPATRDLIFKKRIVDALWGELYKKNKGMMPRGRFGRVGCEKCSGSNYSHRLHATKTELEWDELGWKYLDQLKGLFEPREHE